MPHDKLGQPLAVGDEVVVRCTVTEVQAGTEYCNLQVKTKEPMFPGNDKTTITLNAKQVVKSLPSGVVDPDETKAKLDKARQETPPRE